MLRKKKDRYLIYSVKINIRVNKASSKKANKPINKPCLKLVEINITEIKYLGIIKTKKKFHVSYSLGTVYEALVPFIPLSMHNNKNIL